MIRSTMRAFAAVVLFASSAACAQWAWQPTQGGKFMRVSERQEGDLLTLEIAARRYEPRAGGPVVDLVGVVHVGDQAYYDRLQEFMDSHDLVLYEGVKPAGSGSDLRNADDAAKAKVTKSRQRLLAIMSERYRRTHGEYPATVANLVERTPGAAARLAASAERDGWGREQQFMPAPSGRGVEIVSLGADGEPGGEGAAADIRFSEQKPLTREERQGGGEGIQAQLAEALGLKFQLAAMDYTKPHWRNSDMTVDQIQARLSEENASAEFLFSLLDGRSMAGRLVGMMLNFIKTNPALSLSVKVMLIETLTNADETLGGGRGPANMGAFMKVIIEDRNEEVLKDLQRVIDEEPGVKTVALFYGAGHLPHFEERLVKDFGYEATSDLWLEAIAVDLTTQPGAKAQARQMRAMVRQSIEQQNRRGGQPARDADEGKPADDSAGTD
ncbi:MAG: type II secretion system protein GspG [Phycisphaeraceae bacterium]|nr:type II secretion system protein GspG [Phycisphaeraceae bacterium]